MSLNYNPNDVFIVQRNETSSSFVEKILSAVTNSVVMFDETKSLVAVPADRFIPSVLTASYSASFTGSLDAFLANTTTQTTSSIKNLNSIFNPSNLLVQESNVFIVEEGSDYYVLGDLNNNGAVVVDGTLKVGGGLHNFGPITGIGTLE